MEHFYLPNNENGYLYGSPGVGINAINEKVVALRNISLFPRDCQAISGGKSVNNQTKNRPFY